MQLIVYQGAGHPFAMLPNLDWYVGMMLVGVHRAWPDATGRYPMVEQRHVLPIAICDYLATIGTTVGLIMSGSALFGIIFSSVTVWTAFFTCCLLRKSQTLLKMLGIATCVVGLSLPTLDQAQDTAEGGDELFVGIILTFVGTLFYALEYTLCERAFTLYDRPLDSKQLCFYTGAWGLAFTCVWMAAYTLPHWDEIVTSEVLAAHGSPGLIIFLYATHTLNNGVHNAAWFVVCELESGVSTGLLMGLKAAALFLASAVCFCKDQSPWPEKLDAHREQCMTPTKVAATCIVLLGTALYYWPTKQPPTLAQLDGKGDEADNAKADDDATPARRSARARWKLGLGKRPSVSAADFQALQKRVERLEVALSASQSSPVLKAMPLDATAHPRGALQNGDDGARGRS